MSKLENGEPEAYRATLSEILRNLELEEDDHRRQIAEHIDKRHVEKCREMDE